MRNHKSRGVAALVLVVGVGALGEVQAQTGSGIQLTRDSKRYLISKDVGAERWAISFNLEDRTVTGNVFKTDGSPPSFIWCDITSETPSANPAENQYLLDCYGADACTAAPCSNDAWTLIASGLPISGSFLLPDETRATFSGTVQPIFTQRCAIPACHTGPTPQEGLNLDAGQAYGNTVLRPSAQEEEHFLIEPFDTSVSHLYGKLLGIEEGDQMPQGGPPLPQEQLDAIAAWILEGAANN